MPSLTSPQSPATSDVTVRVLLFSVLRERLGTSSLAVSLLAGQTTDDLIEELSARHAEIRSYSEIMRLAVNESYVDGCVELNDGDEVALITPVSGG